MNKKSWMLPEFGLVTHVHHTTMKKMKTQMANVKNASNYNHDYQTAMQKGYEDGKAKALQEMNALHTQLNQLVISIKKISQESTAQLQQKYLEFIKKCCSAILGREIDLNPDIVLSLLKCAMEQMDSDPIKLYCSPKLMQYFNDNPTVFQGADSIALEIDNALSEYNFRVESDRQHLSLNFDKIISEYIKQL